MRLPVRPPYPESRPGTSQVSLAICLSFHPLGTSPAFSVGKMNLRPGACSTAHPPPPPLDSSGQLLNAIFYPYAHSFTSCLLMFNSTGNRRMRSRSTGARHVPLSGSWLWLALSGSEAASPRCDVMALGFEMFLCKPGSGLQMTCMFTLVNSAILGTHLHIYSQGLRDVCVDKRGHWPSSLET